MYFFDFLFIYFDLKTIKKKIYQKKQQNYFKKSEIFIIKTLNYLKDKKNLKIAKATWDQLEISLTEDIS